MVVFSRRMEDGIVKDRRGGVAGPGLFGRRLPGRPRSPARRGAGSATSGSTSSGPPRSTGWRCSRSRRSSRRRSSPRPSGEIPAGKMRYRADIGGESRVGRGTRPERRAEIPDRPRDGRQERLLFPDPPRDGPPAGPPPRVRRAAEGVVRHHRQPSPPLLRQRAVAALDGPALHLQHLVPRLPREPGLGQLRPGDGHLPHHLDRAGDQLRDVPQPRGGARPRGPRDTEGGTAQGPEAHRHEDLHRGAAQLLLRPVPREDVARVPAVHSRGAVLRPLRPDHPGGPGLLPRRAGPGRELHLHALADEPVRAVGEARAACIATPPAAATGSASPRTRTRPASPATRSGWRTPPPTPATRRKARRAAASPATCP